MYKHKIADFKASSLNRKVIVGPVGGVNAKVIGHLSSPLHEALPVADRWLWRLDGVRKMKTLELMEMMQSDGSDGSDDDDVAVVAVVAGGLFPLPRSNRKTSRMPTPPTALHGSQLLFFHFFGGRKSVQDGTGRMRTDENDGIRGMRGMRGVRGVRGMEMIEGMMISSMILSDIRLWY